MSTSSENIETSTPQPSSSHGANGAAIAVGVVFGIIGAALVAGAIWWTLRRRRLQRVAAESQTPRRPHTIIDPGHLANRVSPFASPGDAPRFGHNPGENMRVAHRRPDGGWEFTDVAPITPTGLSPYYHAPPSPALSSRTTLLFKDKLNPGELTTRGYIEHDMDGVAPPSYSEEDSHSTEV